MSTKWKNFDRGIARLTSRQAGIQATDALMVEQKHVVGPVTSWLSSFVAWAANSTDLRCECSRVPLIASCGVQNRPSLTNLAVESFSLT